MNGISRASCATDLDVPGKQSGFPDRRWSRSDHARGVIRTPVRVILGDDWREG